MRLRLLAAACAAAAIAVMLVVIPGAVGSSNAVPPPPDNPTSADQIQNIDQVRTAIKAYYGDTTTNQVDPVPNSVDGKDNVLHTFSPDSAYAHEMAGIEAEATKYLDHAMKQDGNTKGKFSGKPAILLDIDDTTLNTFDYEIYSNFAFNPATNADFVNAAIFPATPGMPDLVSHAAGEGYTVFFLTGRPISQTAGTIENLTSAGYDVDTENLYLKDASGATEPWLSSCAPSCTTIQYKSLTRQHIESLGYDIVANFGDQFSDLTGGFADQTFKLPNPMYFLP
jgi:hypothetical protein